MHMRTVRNILLAAALSLFAGCARNAIWSTPDWHTFPLSLATNSVTTNEFTLQRARYGVYLHIERSATFPMPYPEHIDCDVSILLCRGHIGYPTIVLDRHSTNSVLMELNNSWARYDLGYFESAERGRFFMVVSNRPSDHHGSAPKARVDIEEIIPK